MCTPGTERAEPRSVAVIGQREGDHGPAQTILDAARHQAHHALVPARIEEAHAAALHRAGRRIAQHDAPPPAPRPASAPRCSRRSTFSWSSCAGERAGASAASSASRQRMPMLMSSSRPAAFSRGATPKARSAAVSSARARARQLEQRADAGRRSARHGCAAGPAPPARGCWHPAARGRRPCPAPPGPATSRTPEVAARGRVRAPPARRRSAAMHVERHADAGQRAAAETAARADWD